jgi:enoyl-CoA hydratase
MSPHVRYEVKDGIATLTLDRPEKRNAMTFAMLREFLEALERAGADEQARVVILTGSGGAFCAGTDLADLASRPGSQRGRASEGSRDWPIVRCPKPVIGAIDGPAVGMGAEFALQCDVRIASPRARFAWNFAHRGLVPDTGAGSWLLPRVVGLPAALRLLYSGEFLTAEQALELGYVARVVAPEELLAAAREEARRYLAVSPFSLRLTKELVYQGLERGVGEHMLAHAKALAACFASEDHKEGVAAFLERRPARFTGR